MDEPVTINPAPPANKGMDYVHLEDEATHIVQELSRDIWTDYNKHDPGVTTIEQLSYALTELSFRAELPVPDILIAPEERAIDPGEFALYPAREILPVNPFTENDYRKLIVDRVRAVQNVWLFPAHKTVYADQCNMPPPTVVNGIYDIWGYAPLVDECAVDERYLSQYIVHRIRAVYNEHRNLCEDVRSVLLLQPLPTRVYATVSIDRDLSPESILAHLLFNLGEFMAPELRRTPLDRLMRENVPVDEIFDGPLLFHGFIDDEELQPKALEIPVRDLIEVMAGTQGVRTVCSDTVRVEVQHEGTFENGDTIDVPRCQIMRLQPYADDPPEFTIQLIRDGMVVEPKRLRVQRELEKLWVEQRRTYDLDAQYSEFLGFPQGTHQDLESYFSIQNQYPNVYGINDFGLPPNAPAQRRGQAKQFKGYLLVFEQLMADFFAQLANTRQLYSLDPDEPFTYFFQSLTDSVPDVAPLLARPDPPEHPGYEQGLAALIHSGDPFIERRNRFLDVLLAMHAQVMDSASIFQTSCANSDPPLTERLLEAKNQLLTYLVPSTALRGRSFDYLAKRSRHNIAGMVIKSRIQLGMDVYEHRPLVDLLDELAVAICDTEKEASLGRPMSRHGQHIAETFVPLSPLLDDTRSPPRESPTSSSTLLSGQRITEAFLHAASAMENFRVGMLPGEQSVALVCKSTTDPDWYLVGKYPGWHDAADEVLMLLKCIGELNRRSQKLYIVEHTLLRSAAKGALPERLPERPRERPPTGIPPNVKHQVKHRFTYSFTITAVLSTCENLRNDPDYQVFACEVIRENTPAHIVSDHCFLSARRMAVFEEKYFAWRDALRRGDESEIIATSSAMRQFLRMCQAASDGPTEGE